jgi:hypothetical protein
VFVVQAEQRRGGAQQPVLKSIEDFNKQNPQAASGARQALSSASRKPSSTVRPDGTASCLNKGCQKDFRIDQNHDSACR